jgi:hypothetical protein
MWTALIGNPFLLVARELHCTIFNTILPPVVDDDGANVTFFFGLFFFFFAGGGDATGAGLAPDLVLLLPWSSPTSL